MSFNWNTGAAESFFTDTNKNFIWPSRQGLYNTPIASLLTGKTPSAKSAPKYDTKQSDGEVLVMQELWGMRSTSLFPLLPGLF